MSQLNENTKAVGKRVLLQLIPEKQFQDFGGIIVPETLGTSENKKLLRGKVISIGEEAKVMGLKINDVVMFDKWSQFSPTGDGKATEKPGDYILVNFDSSIVALVKEK